MESKMEKIRRLQQMEESVYSKTKGLNIQPTIHKARKQDDHNFNLHKENKKKIDVEHNRLLKLNEEIISSREKKNENLDEMEKDICLLLQETKLKDEEKKMASECYTSTISDKEYIKQKIESVEKQPNEKLKYLQKLDKMFQERLGLTFQSTPDKQLQVVYTNIDPKDPSSPYSFYVQFIDDKYIVSNAQPEIPDLNSLTERLNKSDSFRSFVIAVRKYYKQSFAQKS